MSKSPINSGITKDARNTVAKLVESDESALAFGLVNLNTPQQYKKFNGFTTSEVSSRHPSSKENVACFLQLMN